MFLGWAFHGFDEGNNDFTFWALSSYGDSSQMGLLAARVDTVPPTTTFMNPPEGRAVAVAGQITLTGRSADGTFERRLQAYVRADLLVLDDFGLKPLRPPGPEDLYDLINERYEHGSIMLTSNRAPEEHEQKLR